MPPATATNKVSLRELADLAIGTPEVGAVNFTALHTLIVAMLKNLHLQDTRVNFQTLSPEPSRSLEGARASMSTPQVGVPKEKRRSSVAKVPAQTLESQVKDLGGQVQDLNRHFKTMDSQVQAMLDHMQYFTALVSGEDLDAQEWQETQEMEKDLAQEMATPTTDMTTPTIDTATPTIEKTKLVTATPLPKMPPPVLGAASALPETAIPVPGTATLVPEKMRRGLMKMWKDRPKSTELLQTVMQDAKMLKEVREKAQEMTPIKLLQRIEEVERIVRSRDEILEPLSRKLTLIPPGEEVTMVTWEELEQAIADGWKVSQGVNAFHGGRRCGGGLPRASPSLLSGGVPYSRPPLAFFLFNQGSDSTTALMKRRSLRQTSLTSNDMGPSGSSVKSSSVDKTLDSTGGFGPDQTLPGAGRSGYPSEGAPGREQGRLTSAAGFPGREQHPRARDEASLAKTQQPPESQLRAEPRDQSGFAHPGPAPEDSASARGGHRPVHPDPMRAVQVSPGQVYAWPDQQGLEPLVLDQPELLQPSTHPPGVFPFSTSPLGMMPPGMGTQESVIPGMGQQDVVPPRVPGTEQQGLALPSVEQPGVVPLGTYQQGVRLPGTDPRGVEWAGMDESGVGPPGIGQQGFAVFGMDQQGLAPPVTDQHVPGSAGLMQVVTDQQGSVQLSVETPEFAHRGLQQYVGDQLRAIQPGAYPPGWVQPGAHPGLVQPGMDQTGLVEPGAVQTGLVQPAAVQPSFVQPGAVQPSFVQPGAVHPGFVQSEAVQTGLVQHGAVQPGFVQPGAVQPGLVQPGAVQPGLVQPGAVQPGFVQPGAVQPGLVQPGAVQPGFVQPGAVQPGLVQPGAVQPGLVQSGAVQTGLVQPGADQPGAGQPGAVQPGAGQPGAGQPGFVQPGTGQPGFVQPGAGQPGFVQPGAGWPGTGQPGFVQPGAGQPGFVQPGAGQPGTGQPGFVQPGSGQTDAGQPGTGQPGLVQPGAGQPGAVQPGFVQPGAVQPGLVQPGAGQPGAVQPGAGQPGFVQPGAVQPGAVQPGAAQPGFVQPGVGQPGAGRPGFVQTGAAQPGLVQPGAGQPGSVQPGTVQPGAGWPGAVQPGAGQPGSVQPGAGRPGTVQPGAGRPGAVQPGAGQPGFVQAGAGHPGFVQPGAGQPGFVQPGAGQPGAVQPGVGQPGVVQPGAGRPGAVQPGAGRPGAGQPGFVQPGAGQPGAGQPSAVQPGAGRPGAGQPGAGQPGFVQPGAGQPGFVQPGAGQPGAVQPGAGQPGAVQPGAGQPGAGQPGFVQPGAGRPGFVQPGAGQPGFVQPGAGQPGAGQPGAGQPGFVQPGAGRPGFVQPGAGQPGAGQPGFVQPGAGQPGFVQPGAGQPGTGQPGFVQPGAGWPGFVQPGAGWPGFVQLGAGQPGTIQPGTGQPGTGQPGFVQPGAGQPGIIQPGTGQPGAVQPGLVQPGTGQPGLVQPGADQLDLVQPGMDQRGLVQSGVYPPGLVQPGAYPHGVVQRGAYRPDSMQPGTDQGGLSQPGADYQGLVPLGTESRGFPSRSDYPPFTPPRPYQHGVVPRSTDHPTQVSALPASQGLMSPGPVQEGLAPTETYQQGLMPPGTDQRGPTPISTGMQPARPEQQPLAPRGPQQRDHTPSIPSTPGFEYPGPSGLGYPDSNKYVRVVLDPNQPETHIQTTPRQDAASSRRTDSLHHFDQVSPQRSSVVSERHDSLDRMAISFPVAVETFRMMGELIALYMELKETMKELDEKKAGQSDLEKIQYLFSLMVQKTIPPEVQEQTKNIKALAKEFRQEKAKMDKIQKILEGDTHPDMGKEVKSSQLSLQLGLLRVTMADIEKELAELRNSQERGKASLEHSVSEASLYLQDQLDKLRMIIEGMLASSSTLLTMSIAPQKTPLTLTPGHIDPGATCPACSLDLGHQVSTLVQRYEQLQNMVNSLAASRPSKKAKLQSQDEELLGHVQRAILQVQGDCEKLNITTSNLIADHQQKQKDITALYQGLEKLEREKANREHLEMEIDVKADKSALAGKVSRVQFDATTEQLNHMMQELVAKMSGQEQDWQKMLDRLLLEMDSKLDRLELDPVKQLLEDRWKSLRQQLKERSPLYQADEAACMRRQLLAHFHCLSCDRPLETPVTGQPIPVTPVGPSLPGSRSTRPYTIFELDQVRQQSRSLKLGSGAFLRADLAPLERSVGRLHSMHSKMLMDIEKVQIHYGGSVKASSQMIRELLQAQCLSSPCYKRVPDVSDYAYSPVPRPCGGSHTLTYPYRRARLQHLPQGLHPEEIQLALKHEVDILGLDGHIYKGRMDTRLPGIPSKDSDITRHKTKLSRLLHVQRHPSSLGDSGQLPSRPQSAEVPAGNTSASPPQRADRPVSSQGRLSQQLSAQEGPEMRLEVPPGEGLEEPTRGPRSSADDRAEL
ncbi:glutamine-rich protein 2 [Phyllostomus discolor]|uniref:Glutamine-rich protein 2 n=1 Tax=Phyllostomus discolor TaxID=89673 RepID=A0A7E6CD76_9CHIR|nr:glutamine-rich protein 2 [Phyllostomus discolor]